MSKENNTIFVQCASYRDPELAPTMKDMIVNAKYPENIRVGICNQFHPDDKFNIDEYREDNRFRIIDIPHEEAKGVCWARALIQELYDNEGYTLQIDSHARFIKDWDVKLIKEVKDLQEDGIKKPLLTSYAPSYDPEKYPAGRIEKPWRMDFDRFSPDGNVHFLPSTIDDNSNLTKPIPARFYSAHFAFSIGDFVKEVPHDPQFYFHGEEISIAVRAFTHGYDLFHPHNVYLWHYYTRRGAKKHWDDHNTWVDNNNKSHSRNRKLLGVDGEIYDADEFGVWGLGSERTLNDYERYSGIKFNRRAVLQHTLDKKDPPCPVFENNEDYENAFSSPFKHCIDVHFDSVPHDDYDFWAVAFEDENGVELHREDADRNEIKRMKTDPDKFCRLWRNFNTTKRVYKWIVWPHSESEGWGDRMEGTLYEKK